MTYNAIISKKSLGKKPAKTVDTASIDGTDGTPPVDDLAISAAQARQIRRQPTRSRRGGPGVGSCDVDIGILDSLRRKGENEPLIPSTSLFVLTTDPNFIPPPSTSDLGVNSTANERYFDKPEVIKAFKEQQDIQTPEFVLLSEDARVGGRLRARGQEVDATDLSDAAYERRHRKYETFEKRQRLREKEKLMHEHYKLKERIDQLRAMDYTAFLALPASNFGEEESTEAEVVSYVPTSLSHNSEAVQEGERRRNLMLSVASSLERRYRTLLPDKRTLEMEKSGERSSLSVEPSASEEQTKNFKNGVSEQTGVSSSRSSSLKVTLRVPRPVNALSSSPKTKVPVPPIPEHRKRRTRSSILRLPSRSPSPPQIQAPEAILENLEYRTLQGDADDEKGPTYSVESLELARRVDTSELQPEIELIGRATSRRDSMAGLVSPDLSPSVSHRSVAQVSHIPLTPPEQRSRPGQIATFRVESWDGSRHSTDGKVAGGSMQYVFRIDPDVNQSISNAPTPTSPSTRRSTKRTRVESPDVQTISNGSPPKEQSMEAQSDTAPASPTSDNEYSSVSGQPGRRRHVPAILVEASHYEGAESSRKTSRHSSAFGVKVPDFPKGEFEIPGWLEVFEGQRSESPEEAASFQEGPQSFTSLLDLANVAVGRRKPT